MATGPSLRDAFGISPLMSLTHDQRGALSAYGIGLSTAAKPKNDWAYVIRRFQTFLGNLELTPNQIADGEGKWHGAVECLNAAYYGSASNTDHAFLIGSWAKGTRIRPPRDVDLYFLLPPEVYSRFEQTSGNKQSALLQEVKQKLLVRYPRSDVKGDGPVVLAGFHSYELEIVPVFALQEFGAYWICDTKAGGRYVKTMPHVETQDLEAADARNNRNVRRLIRMLKCWQAYCSVPIRSFYLELLAVKFMDQWAHRQQGYFYYDWMCRDFFGWLPSQANTMLFAPGTYEILRIGDAWKTKAESAYGRAYKACEYERDNEEGAAGDEWQKIFGTAISKWL